MKCEGVRGVSVLVRWDTSLGIVNCRAKANGVGWWRAARREQEQGGHRRRVQARLAATREAIQELRRELPGTVSEMRACRAHSERMHLVVGVFVSFITGSSSMDSKRLGYQDCALSVLTGKWSPDICCWDVQVSKADVDFGAGSQYILFRYARAESEFVALLMKSTIFLGERVSTDESA